MRALSRTANRDHPRIRGEHRGKRTWLIVDEGSSPHTRGARQTIVEKSKKVGISPAYAGSTSRSSRRASWPREHPRIRGEHTVNIQSGTQSQGSSPHMRGAQYRRRDERRRVGIIPAYAGSTVVAMLPSGVQRDHPRIRGEHFIAALVRFDDLGSSPHTRGAPAPARRESEPQGIIPAYAGSTPSSIPARRLSRDHPRIRGEHEHSTILRSFFTGSSPHTRGARAG